MVHGLQVRDPFIVYDLKQNISLHMLQLLFSKKSLLFFVDSLHLFLDQLHQTLDLQLGKSIFPHIFGAHLHPETKMPEEIIPQFIHVPVFGVVFRIDQKSCNTVNFIIDHLPDNLPYASSEQDVLSQGVDNLPVFVHDVIIFQEILPDVEVVPFHLLLGVFNPPGDEFVFDRFSFLHPETLHNGGYPVGTEDPEEIILKGEIKAGRPRVSLSPRTPSELIVHTTTFMPFRTKNVQTTRFPDPFPQNDVGTPSRHVCGNGHSL